MHDIKGVKNECADYISRKTLDDMIGARFVEPDNGAFSRMDVHLDLRMTMIRPLDGLQQVEYLKVLGYLETPGEGRYVDIFWSPGCLLELCRKKVISVGRPVPSTAPGLVPFRPLPRVLGKAMSWPLGPGVQVRGCPPMCQWVW